MCNMENLSVMEYKSTSVRRAMKTQPIFFILLAELPLQRVSIRAHLCVQRGRRRSRVSSGSSSSVDSSLLLLPLPSPINQMTRVTKPGLEKGGGGRTLVVSLLPAVEVCWLWKNGLMLWWMTRRNRPPITSSASPAAQHVCVEKLAAGGSSSRVAGCS